MKVCLVNTHDNIGGAAIAAYRLHQALQQTGIDSRMLVQHKITSDNTVIGPRPGIEERLGRVRRYIDRHIVNLYPQRDRKATWSINAFPHRIASNINALNPDIVHLHWIGLGFVPVSEIRKIKKPIVWTLHDMWAFTGGCHYSGDCTRFREQCGRCPQLGSNTDYDISTFLWKKKAASFQNRNLVVVSPSKWLAECARESFLFRNVPVEVIPNGIDTGIFRPIEKSAARMSLGLPLDKKLILFGAMNSTGDKRKGFPHLVSALKQLSARDPSMKPECVIFGSTEGAPVEIPGFHVHNLGKVPGEERLALVYSAADVFVAPSVQENLANTVMESMSCGTPVVTFNIGGMPDMIDHQTNGYLAKPFDTSDMARGIAWVLSEDSRIKSLSTNARHKVTVEYDHLMIKERYSKLYQKNIL
jgi:glycosyltransferase involved in cell wall biosynthesis